MSHDPGASAPQQPSLIKKAGVLLVMAVLAIGAFKLKEYQENKAHSLARERLAAFAKAHPPPPPPVGVAGGPPMDYSEDTSAALLAAHLDAHVPRDPNNPAREKHGCLVAGMELTWHAVTFRPGENTAQEAVGPAIEHAYASGCWVDTETRDPAPGTTGAKRGIFPVLSQVDRMKKLREHVPEVERCRSSWDQIQLANADMPAGAAMKPSADLQASIDAAAAHRCWR